MGNRFITARFIGEHPDYSAKRVSRRLNDNRAEPHRIRPYGLPSAKFAYTNMFERNRGRNSNRAVERSVKKSARQQAQRSLREDM